MVTDIKYYISNSTNPYENLAIEKFLLESVPEGCCILYLWQNENTVVIGKNQNPWAECRISELEKDGTRLARRMSGGGAVFHDSGNLNFTFISKTYDMDIKKNLDTIRLACSMAGINTEFSGRNDLLTNGKKFSGNAFYNSKGNSYHHGTILVSADLKKLTKYLTPPKAKLESKGIKSVSSRVINLSELSPALTCENMKKYILDAFCDTYNIKAEEIKYINKDFITPVKEEYESWEYLYGKVIPFTISFYDKLSFGNTELLLEIKSGIIINAQCFTDSMDDSISETICKLIINCPFDIGQIEERLNKKFTTEITKEISDMITKKTM